MIGDRVETDIQPAKEIKIKTILVWGQSNIPDFCVSTVYEVGEILA